MYFLQNDQIELIRNYHFKYIVGNEPIPDTLPGMRDEILASWKRSREMGVSISEVRNSNIPMDLHQNLLDQYQDLIQVADSYLQMLFDFLSGTDACMQLFDPTGCVLKFYATDQNIADLAQSLSERREGYRITEDLIGTNSSALCIQLKRPIQVIGPEHYRMGNHVFYCSSAPILDKDKNLLAGITIMAPMGTYQSHTLSTVCATASGIERELEIRRAYNELNISKNILSSCLNDLSSGVLILDENKRIEHYNQKILHILQMNPSDLRGRSLYEVIQKDSLNPDIAAFDRNLKNYSTAITTCRGQQVKIVMDLRISNYEAKSGKHQSIFMTINKQTEQHSLANKINGAFATYTFDDIIGNSPATNEMIRQCQKAAFSPSNILITGESGTGKELLAQSIHNYSQRAKGPFIAVNCGALPKSLIESELFGYEYGAFSGASKNGKPGKFELADGGTIFLDEIGELPLELQATFLRVLQTHEVTRLGGKYPQSVDVKIIAATNADLPEMIRQNRFRADLYYRLNVLNILVPPLRQRRNDIPLLVDYFIHQYNRSLASNVQSISDTALDILMNYSWPGNVRELENTIERAVNIAPGDTIRPEDLPSHLTSAGTGSKVSANKPIPQESYNGMINNHFRIDNETHPVTAYEKKPESSIVSPEMEEYAHLQECLAQYKGHVKSVAAAMNMPTSTLYRKLQKYNLNPKDFKKW